MPTQIFIIILIKGNFQNSHIRNLGILNKTAAIAFWKLLKLNLVQQTAVRLLKVEKNAPKIFKWRFLAR